MLTPNKAEAATLLGRDIDDLEDLDDNADFGDALALIADRYGAVVTCFQTVAAPGGERWQRP